MSGLRLVNGRGSPWDAMRDYAPWAAMAVVIAINSVVFFVAGIVFALAIFIR